MKRSCEERCQRSVPLMYRYSQHVRDGMGLSRTRQRVLSILCVIFLASSVVLGVVAYRAGGYRSEHRVLQEKRMLQEANQALSQYNSLSRTGGSSSSSVLGKIRQHVYALKALEEMNDTLNGVDSRRVDETIFSRIFSILDAFEVKLQTGQSSTEQQASLLEHLNYLVAVYQ